MKQFVKKIQQFRQTKQTGTALFLSCFLASVGLILALSLIVSQIVMRYAEKNTAERFESTLQVISNSVDYILSDVYAGAYYLYNDNSAAQVAINGTNFTDTQLADIYAALMDSKNISSLVDSVYFVNSSAFVVFSSAGDMTVYNHFFDLAALDLLNYPQGTNTIFELRTIKDTEVISFALPAIHNTMGQTGGIIVNLNQAKVQNLFNQNIDADAYVYILNERWQTISSSDSAPADLFSDADLQDALEEAMLEGNAFSAVLLDGEKYFISYQYAYSFDLVYLSVIPYETLLSSVRALMLQITLVTLVVFLLGLLLAHFALKRYYTPLKQLVSTIQATAPVPLQQEKSRNEFVFLENAYKHLEQAVQSATPAQTTIDNAKNHLLYLLLRNDRIPNGFLTVLAHNEIYFNEPEFLVCKLQIADYEVLQSRYSAKDVALVKYGMANIGCELFRENVVCEALETGRDYIVFILNGEEKKFAVEQVAQVLETVMKEGERCFGQSFYAGISEVGATLESIHLAYEQAQDACGYSQAYAEEGVVSYRHIIAQEGTHIKYPYEQEKQIVASMRSGNRTQSMAQIANFFESLRSTNLKEVNSYIMRLSATLQRNLYLISPQSEELLSIQRMERQLEDCQTIVAKQEYLQALAALNIDQKEEKAQYKNADILLEIFRYIEAHYAEEDLSVDAVATHVGYSTSHFRKIFKDMSNNSFNEYLLEYRMDKAKELLKETELSAKDIAEQVGCTNIKYFYSMFKKNTGMTTYEYRTKTGKASAPAETELE